jgi:hypothetical protein
MFFILGSAIILLSFISEFWTIRYYIAAQRGDAGAAVLYSGMLFLAGAFAIILYVEDWRYLIPDFLGTIAGTYYAVRRKAS